MPMLSILVPMTKRKSYCYPSGSWIFYNRTLKKDPKAIEFLKSHRVHISNYDWQKDEWDLKTLGVFTNVDPSTMLTEYGTKIISKFIKNPIKQQKFRIKILSMQTMIGESSVKTKVFGIEVRYKDVQVMTDILRENLTSGVFMPFQMQRANKVAFSNAVQYVASKKNNVWTILIQYMTEGALFKLEEKIKVFLDCEHVIYDPQSK